MTRELITSALGASGSASSEGTIPALLELKRKLDVVLTDAFEKDDKMRHALQEAFEQLLNTKGNSVAEDVGACAIDLSFVLLLTTVRQPNSWTPSCAVETRRCLTLRWSGRSTRHWSYSDTPTVRMLSSSACGHSGS